MEQEQRFALPLFLSEGLYTYFSKESNDCDGCSSTNTKNAKASNCPALTFENTIAFEPYELDAMVFLIQNSVIMQFFGIPVLAIKLGDDSPNVKRLMTVLSSRAWLFHKFNSSIVAR